MRRLPFVGGCALALCALLCLPPTGALAQGLTFADAQFETMAARALQKDAAHLGLTDFQDVTTLCVYGDQLFFEDVPPPSAYQGGGLTSLGDLALFPSLTKLVVWNQPALTFDQGLGLPHPALLTELNLGDVPLADLAPLSPLTHLERLTLRQVGAEDLTPLSSLTNLTFLSLPRNRIQSLTGLESLGNLVELRISQNQIGDLWPLAGLSLLERVDAFSNGVSSLAPLVGLKLRYLSVDDNPITDVSPLYTMRRLDALYVTYDNANKINRVHLGQKMPWAYVSP